MVLNCLIWIYDQTTLQPKLRFPFATEVVISTSRNNFTDTCRIVLPQRTRRVNKKISDLIQVGDIVDVFLGYKPELNLEFQGYVNAINPDSPMVLECEDLSFKYKNKSIGQDYVLKDTTFRELISTIYDREFLTTNDNIGTWKISKNATVVDVLDSLKKVFGTPSYWQDNILYVNYEFAKQPEKTILFDVQKNVPLGSDNIDVNVQTNLSIISHGVSPQKDGTINEAFAYYENNSGKVIRVTANRPEGVLNTLKFPNLTQETLEQRVKERLPRLYYAGVSGDITGISPSFKHGDRLAIRDRRITDKNGIYDVPEVTKMFGVGYGFKHLAKAGLKLEDFS